MSQTLVECVPNFSEGRDPAKVDAIVAAIRSTGGVTMLGQEMDFDHNRSVVTFAAPAGRIGEAAFRGVAMAVDLIDLRMHAGVHPRIGAADVVPFVPIRGVTLQDCVTIAEAVAQRIWEELRVPVYMYEAAARHPARTNLENIRRGGFEGLRDGVRRNPDRLPDFGEAELHPSAGATVVGARKFLIAYNINLSTPDVAVAKRIARVIRFSSGGFPHVKAMGVPLASRNLAQVSMNLTDFETTPLHQVFETVKREAARDGVAVEGSEIVGLIPRRAIEMAAEWFLRVEHFHPSMVLENLLEETMANDGLRQFLNDLSAPEAPAGGGSAAAAAAAMAAAVGAKVSALAQMPHEPFEAACRFLTEAAERDADAFRGVLRACEQPREQRLSEVEQALHEAARVPLEVAEETFSTLERLKALAQTAPSKFSPDIETALALARAGLTGAIATVRMNLVSMHDQDLVREIEERLDRLSSGAINNPAIP